MFGAEKYVLAFVHQSPEGKLTGQVAAYQAWLAAQLRRNLGEV